METIVYNEMRKHLQLQTTTEKFHLSTALTRKHTFPSLEQQDHTLSSCFFNSSACFCTVSFRDSRTSFTSTSAAASFLSSSMFSLLRDSVFSVNCARRKVFSRCSSCRHRQPLNLGGTNCPGLCPHPSQSPNIPQPQLKHSETAPGSAARCWHHQHSFNPAKGNLRGHRGDGNSTQGIIYLLTLHSPAQQTPQQQPGPSDSAAVSHWHLLYLHSQHVDVSIGGWAAQQGTVNLQLTLPDLLLQLGNVLPLSVTKQAIHCSQT